VSYGVDVNILLYASDQGAAMQSKAAAFLDECAKRSEVFCLAWLTIMSYLRMATHPAIFSKPLSHEEAARNVEALLSLPHCRVIVEQDSFWPEYRALTGEVPTRGNLVPDAHLAAVLRSNGITRLYTHDRDFRKFSFLDARDPLA
jgi:uncharacterized protein